MNIKAEWTNKDALSVSEITGRRYCVNVSTTPIADSEYIVQDSLYPGKYELTFCKNCNEWVRVQWTTVTRCPLCGKEIFK